MDIIQTVDATAVKGWDAVVAGVHYLEAEATKLKNAVEKADPGLQAQVQTLITDGEAAAQALAARGESALSNIEAAGMDDLETLVANYMNAAGPGSGVTGLAITGLKDFRALLQSGLPVVIAKVLAALAPVA